MSGVALDARTGPDAAPNGATMPAGVVCVLGGARLDGPLDCYRRGRRIGNPGMPLELTGRVRGTGRRRLGWRRPVLCVDSTFRTIANVCGVDKA
jgi:hypothetical protein